MHPHNEGVFLGHGLISIGYAENKRAYHLSADIHERLGFFSNLAKQVKSIAQVLWCIRASRSRMKGRCHDTSHFLMELVMFTKTNGGIPSHTNIALENITN